MSRKSHAKVTQKLAQRWGVRLYRYVNVGNPIYLLARVPSRIVWRRFLRELTGGIALIVTGAKKNGRCIKHRPLDFELSRTD